MKTNNFFSCIVVIAFTLVSCGDKSSTTPTPPSPPVPTVKTAGTLSISTTTASTDPLDPTGGPSSTCEYAPNNIVAIWIEDNAGKFVKTLTAWGITRRDDLLAWKASSAFNLTGLTVVAGKTPSLPQPDATTGATLTGYGKISCTWDGKNTAGAIVADGDYKVKFELTDNGIGGTVRSMTVLFTKGPTAVTPSVANVTSFSSNSVTWVPKP